MPIKYKGTANRWSHGSAHYQYIDCRPRTLLRAAKAIIWTSRRRQANQVVIIRQPWFAGSVCHVLGYRRAVALASLMSGHALCDKAFIKMQNT